MRVAVIPDYQQVNPAA